MAIASEEPVKRRYDPSMSRRTRKPGSGSYISSVEKPLQIFGKDDMKKQASGDPLMEDSVAAIGKEEKTQSDNDDSENPLQIVSINEEEKKINVGFISSSSFLAQDEKDEAFGGPLMEESVEAEGKEEKNSIFTDDDENPMQINGNKEENKTNVLQIHGKDEKNQAFGDPLMEESVETDGKEEKNPIFTNDENPMQINGNMEENQTNFCRSSLEEPTQANIEEKTQSDMNNIENSMKFNDNAVENQESDDGSMQLNGVRRSSLELLMKSDNQHVDLDSCKLAMEGTGEEEDDEKKTHLLVVVKHSDGLKGAKMVSRYAKFLKYLIKGTRGHKNKNAVRWTTK